MTFCHCRLILEMETEPGTKSRFHYLCLEHHHETITSDVFNLYVL